MTDITIVPAGIEDADRLYEIECASFSIPWSRDSFITMISDREHAMCLTARTGVTLPGKTVNAGTSGALQQVPLIAGYTGVLYVLDEGEITNIAVHPDYRGRGIGFALLRAAQDFCRQSGVHTLHLEVRPSNTGAIALYRKCCFVQSGKRRGYYADNGEDALLYSWKDM